jgi:hypothetical protein
MGISKATHNWQAKNISRIRSDTEQQDFVDRWMGYFASALS